MLSRVSPDQHSLRYSGSSSSASTRQKGPSLGFSPEIHIKSLLHDPGAVQLRTYGAAREQHDSGCLLIADQSYTHVQGQLFLCCDGIVMRKSIRRHG